MKFKYLITVIFLTSISFSQNYHDTQGKLEVTNTGQATYTLPIAMPPSVQNVGPTINLNYVSGTLGGNAGQGWNISTISTVSRMSTRKDIEGYIDGVNFDADDKLALDGQRLILKSGNYWQDGSTYETEVQSNTKIELKGTGNNIYFIVTTPDGSRTWYGNYGGVSGFDLSAYYIVRFEDTNGNYMTYHYSDLYQANVIPGLPQVCVGLYVNEIRFSANTNVPLTPLNKIVFNYKQLNRNENAYLKGEIIARDKILDKVEVFTNNLLFRKYQITDSNDPLFGYQRVIMIQEFNGALESANPIVFEYKDSGTDRYQEAGKNFTNNFALNSVLLSGDFDGDGKLDFTSHSQMFKQLFNGGTGAPPINFPANLTNSVKKFTATTVKTGKLNQYNTIIAPKENVNSIEFAVYGLNAAGTAMELHNTKVVTVDNQQNCFMNCEGAINPNFAPCNTSQANTTAKFIEGDFNGDGISEVIVFRFINSKFYGLDMEHCLSPEGEPLSGCPCAYDYTYTSEHSYSSMLVNLDYNSATTFPSSGAAFLSDFHISRINDKTFVSDYNGDGKSDILVVNDDKTYKIYTIKQLQADPWIEVEIIGQGSMPNYDNNKQILFGDYNGDGKTDLMMPEASGNGCEDQPSCSIWYIYYSNPNPAGGNFFRISSQSITPYMPAVTLQTQSYYNSYFSIDINKDGKTDLVRLQRRYFKPNWTINDHDTEWTIMAFVNNIGKMGSLGFEHYYTTGNHMSFNNVVVAPVVSTFSNIYFHSDMVIVSEQSNSVHYISFPKDVYQENLLTKVTSSGGSIVDEVIYNPFTSSGSLGSLYSSTNSSLYPNVEINKLPYTQFVSMRKNTADGVTKNQVFRYHGYVVNMNGLGTLGFKKVARSEWFLGTSDPKNWSFVENNTEQLRGATIRSYTQYTSQNQSPLFILNGTNPSGIINSTVNEFSATTSGNVFTMLLTKKTTTDFITNVVNETSYVYSPTYNLPLTVTTKNFLGTALQGTITGENEYDPPTLGVGNSYYIGRPSKITTTNSAYLDVYKTEEKFTYTNNNITKIEKKGNTTNNIYLTEEMLYDSCGNVTKKTVSAPSFVPSIVPRVTEYTYDDTKRFVKTVKGVDGLVSTNLNFHPVYGMVTSSQNPFNQITASVYDNWGKRITITDYLGKSINYSYSRSGNVYTTNEVNDDGSSGIVLADALGRTTKKGAKNIDNTWSYLSYEYDFKNRKKKTSEPYNGASPSLWNQTDYDQYDRVIKTTNATGLQTTIIYSGLIVTANDGTKVTSSTKNANGHVVSATDPGGTITYEYYANGNLKTSTFDGTVVTMEYDEWGRKKKMIDPSAGTYEYTYNAFGEQLKEITPNGTTTITYDATGKMITKAIVGSSTNYFIEYSYDPTTKLLTLVDGTDTNGNSTATEYFYDSNKRLITFYQADSTSQYFFEKRYEYDGFGRVNREYNYAENLSDGKSSAKWIKKTYMNGEAYQILDDTSNQVLWQTNTVNARGQITNGKFGNDIVITNSYDNYGYLTQMSYNKINTNPGNVLTLTTSFNQQRGILNSRSNSLFSWNETFTYDNLDRLTGFTDNNGTQTQTYDNKGRITNNSTIGDYAYNTTKKYQATGVTLNTTGKIYYADKPLQEITYNTFKSPIAIKEQEKEFIDISYGGSLSRTVMYYGGIETNKNLRPLRKFYTEDGTMEIKRNITTNSVEFVTYIGGDGYTAPIALKSDGTTQNYYYLHRDYLGSILAITNSSGAVVEKRHFDAWGSLVKLQNGANTNLTSFALLDRGYTGHEHLLGVGLINMNGRLYDPKVHRFLMPDNFIQDPHNTQNYNRYGYVLNNPLKYNDISGEEFGLLAAVTIGAIIAATTYTVTALLADVPFTVGGLIKSTVIGAASAAVTFGIGEAASTIGNFYTRSTFQFLVHGSFQGTMSGVQGGNFWTGFASGSLSSLASSAWQGGATTEVVDNTVNVYSHKGVSGFLGLNNGFGTIAFGTIAGGAGAALTNGNFWQGAVTGLFVSGLNHVVHGIYFKKTLMERFAKGKLDPFAKPKFTQEGMIEMRQNVEGLEEVFIVAGKPSITFDEKTDFASTVHGNVKLNPSKLDTNYNLAATLFHEFRHAWQYFSGKYDKWVIKFPANAYTNGYWDVMERDAYWFQIKMGAGDFPFTEGYSRYFHYRNLTSKKLPH